MADEPERSSKTEDPSAKRLEDAHKRGDVVKSQEVNTWFMLSGSALVFLMLAPSASSGLLEALRSLLANADQYEVGAADFSTFVSKLAWSIALLALLPLVVLFAFAVAGNLIQHRPLLSLDPISPKLERISPLSGLKRLASSEALVNFVKGLFKLAIVGAALFYVLWPLQDRLEPMITADLAVLMATAQEASLKVFGAALAVMTLIAIVDYVYQRQRWWQRHKMTLQEVKDEFKQMEGDPKIKGRLRQLRLERSRRRMMVAVPDATVVITNPTHYAVALKYTREMSSPRCVAKGVDALALRIRAVATEHDVPVIENPPLARALYASVDIDESIPAEHFKAVAQVIGYVMRLKAKSKWRA